MLVSMPGAEHLAMCTICATLATPHHRNKYRGTEGPSMVMVNK